MEKFISNKLNGLWCRYHVAISSQTTFDDFSSSNWQKYTIFVRNVNEKDLPEYFMGIQKKLQFIQKKSVVFSLLQIHYVYYHNSERERALKSERERELLKNPLVKQF